MVYLLFWLKKKKKKNTLFPNDFRLDFHQSLWKEHNSIKQAIIDASIFILFLKIG